MDVKTFFLGEENWGFLLQVALRTILMYIIILIALRLLGKRGVKQLSVFELVVIISLGSAAGDPMVYKEIGILTATAVFVMIVLAYRLTTYLIDKNRGFEKMIEGSATCLVHEGKFDIKKFEDEPLTHDEFYSELRQQSVTHLGQVKIAIIESSGNISLFFYPDEEVKPGLSILPDEFKEILHHITETGEYACNYCGFTKELSPAPSHQCPECKKDKWVTAMDETRIS
jgi:uncharacterized membrane protein YcaP (DUF421 family)